MKYKGIELKEIKITDNVAFNPPRDFLVWDDIDKEAMKITVCAIVKTAGCISVISADGRYYWRYFMHIAEIPTARTNWEAFAEAKKIDAEMKEDIVKFFDYSSSVACLFCPAERHCRRAMGCQDAINEWANAPAEEDGK